MFVGGEHSTPHGNPHQWKNLPMNYEIGVGDGLQQVLAHLELNVEVPTLVSKTKNNSTTLRRNWWNAIYGNATAFNVPRN